MRAYFILNIKIRSYQIKTSNYLACVKETYIYFFSKKMDMGIVLKENGEETVVRKLTFFEIGLSFAGIAVMFVGFYAVHKQYLMDGYLSWGLLHAIFLWLILLVLLIVAAILENVKEELGVMIKEHILETKLLRQEAVMLKECVKRKR